MSPRGKPPAAGKEDDAFVRCINELLEKCDKTQREIASDMGYDHPNIVSMFKTGTTRLPLIKVPEFAFAVGADTRELVLLWLDQYEPEMKAMLEKVLGGSLTPNETSWLRGLREVFDGELPPFDEDARSMNRTLALLKKGAARR